ncbi:MAG TPA: capsule assembly Wzi family protein [Steroidobacteraceae bacterium]
MKSALRTSAWLVAALLPSAPALADPWIAPGDSQLRHDLELLADSGLLRAPLTAWPVSWAEVARDVGGITLDAGRPAWLGAALERVQASARNASRTGSLDGNVRLAGSENPMALRRFGDLPREEGEISAGVQYTGHRFAYRLQATGVADPDDDQSFRPDGSYAAVVLGNWMLHAGYIDRWWGPGWEGSLIYGNNARPIPSVTLERNYSDPIEHPWLEWIGRFRFAVTMGRFEDDRDDAPNANFFGSRITWKPHPRVEIGISRSAQWCGDGRPCDAGTFWDLLTGNDNDQPPAEQPGNQMAGFDLRWSLPWMPVALYAQAIGEDEAGFLPSEYLGLGGVEFWGGFGDRSWRAHVEYADTACDFFDDAPDFGCAYRHSIYFDGYQYRDRSMGHALDGDSEQVAAGVMLVNGDGSSWELAAQSAKVNRESANPVHSVALQATRIRSADLYHRRALLGGELSLAIGYEQRESAAAGLDESDVRGLVQWRRDFE